MAHQVLGSVAGGGDPANERAEARGMPTLGQAFDEFMAANPNRAPTTDKGYRDFVERYLGDWLGRPLDAIARRDVEARFNRITTQSGWATANRTIWLLRSAYNRLSLPFIPSCLPTTARLSGTDIILSQWIL